MLIFLNGWKIFADFADLNDCIKYSSFTIFPNKAGLTRTVCFKDGSTSQESLLTVEAPTSFSYRNEHFTSKTLSALLERLEGQWLFTDLGNNTTKIEWTYRAIPTNFFAKLMVKLVLMRAMRSMLKDALDIIKNDLETGQLEKGTTRKA